MRRTAVSKTRQVWGVGLLLVMASTFSGCSVPAPPSSDWTEEFWKSGAVTLDAGDGRVYVMRAESESSVRVEMDRTQTHDLAVAISVLLMLILATLCLSAKAPALRGLGVLLLVLAAFRLYSGFSQETHVLDFERRTYTHTTHNLLGLVPQARTRASKELGKFVLRRACADPTRDDSCFDFVELEIGHNLSQTLLKIRAPMSPKVSAREIPGDRPTQRLVARWNQSWM